MLEKDIENLIASHPTEFFPKEDFTLIAQQYQIQGRRIDILFADKHGRYIIIEVKRGILSREASGQIIEYYGLVKQQFQDRSVELILCANVIPHERKSFLENVGIECKEISVRLISEVAEKFKYSFLDSKKDKSDNVTLPSITHNISATGDDAISVWIFQANPQIYDILNALDDDEVSGDIRWYVGQHKGKIKEGHIAIIWMSGAEGGIYAIAKILTDPEEMEENPHEKKYHLNADERPTRYLAAKLSVVRKLVNHPILRVELKAIQQLNNLSILKCAQGTNFPVTDDEWAAISKLITARE